MRKLLLRSIFKKPLTAKAPKPCAAAVEEAAKALVSRPRRLLGGRSLAVRAVDAGSCNGCELEIHALNNAVYDLERFGVRLVASPRHADALLVTGPVTKNMREALLRTYDATPAPKWVIALGDCACTGGVFAKSHACIGAVDKVLDADLHIPGCPPPPALMLEWLLGLLEVAGGK